MDLLTRRDPKRIKRILKLIEELWTNSDQQRFGQIMINNRIFRDNLAVWIEDDYDLEERLKRKVENIKNE